MRTVIDENFLANLELFSLAVKDNVAGLFGGNHKSKRFGSSSEFADYREYIDGDDISKIDWNIYGRSEKMFLKLYLDERQMQTRIYIDASNSMGFYKKRESPDTVEKFLLALKKRNASFMTFYHARLKADVRGFEGVLHFMDYLQCRERESYEFF